MPEQNPLEELHALVREITVQWMNAERSAIWECSGDISGDEWRSARKIAGVRRQARRLLRQAQAERKG